MSALKGIARDSSNTRFYCPECGQEMTRIERKKWQRMLSIVYPVIRVACCDEEYLVKTTRENANLNKKDFIQQKLTKPSN